MKKDFIERKNRQQKKNSFLPYNINKTGRAVTPNKGTKKNYKLKAT